MAENKIANEDTVLAFGKYKGSTVATVAEQDPKYLIWAEKNIEWFSIDPELMESIHYNAAN